MSSEAHEYSLRYIARPLYFTAKDEAIFSEALREIFPTIGFLDGVAINEPVRPACASLADCVARSGHMISAPDDSDWVPEIDANPKLIQKKRIRNMPVRSLDFSPSRWIWRHGHLSGPWRWAWDPPTLEDGDIYLLVARRGSESHPGVQFSRGVSRVLRKLSTNRLKCGHELTNKLMGDEVVLMKSRRGGLNWAGFHALDWCRQRPRRMLGGLFRPCDDWEPPKSKWYRRLVSKVEERYGADFGIPPEDEPEELWDDFTRSKAIFFFYLNGNQDSGLEDNPLRQSTQTPEDERDDVKDQTKEAHTERDPEGELRWAVPGDLPRLFEICKAHSENPTDDSWKAFSRDGRRTMKAIPVWVWTREDRVLGFAYADPRNGWIEMLYVDPEAQGQGIGQALLRQCCNDLRTAGYGSANLATTPGSRAERFYRRNGWVKQSVMDTGDIVLKKWL